MELQWWQSSWKLSGWSVPPADLGILWSIRPHDLVAEIGVPPYPVHQRLQEVASCRVAMKIDAACREGRGAWNSLPLLKGGSRYIKSTLEEFKPRNTSRLSRQNIAGNGNDICDAVDVIIAPLGLC